jgi:hypothetical protein
VEPTAENFQTEKFGFQPEGRAAELEKKDQLRERVNLASGFLTATGPTRIASSGKNRGSASNFYGNILFPRGHVDSLPD